MRIQCADVKKVLGSVHKMNMGGNVIVLDGEKSYMQNKETSTKTRINCEQGQYVMYVWIPSKEKEAEEYERGGGGGGGGKRRWKDQWKLEKEGCY